ncbi:MAG: hypothetical protein ACXW5U_15800 [Thermoanaerobaculia bacterium]
MIRIIVVLNRLTIKPRSEPHAPAPGHVLHEVVLDVGHDPVRLEVLLVVANEVVRALPDVESLVAEMAISTWGPAEDVVVVLPRTNRQHRGDHSPDDREGDERQSHPGAVLDYPGDADSCDDRDRWKKRKRVPHPGVG